MLFWREIWRTLGFWTRKAVECDNQGLKGHPSRILEDSCVGAVWAVETQVRRFQRGTELTTVI